MKDPLANTPFAPRQIGAIFEARRFLLDEDIDEGDAVKLRMAGCDAVSVRDRPDLRSLPDPDVMQAAYEENRVLVTYDKGHGNAVFGSRVNAPPGVVLIREQKPRVAETLLWLLSETPLVDRFVAVNGDKCHGQRMPLSASRQALLDEIGRHRPEPKRFVYHLPQHLKAA